MENTVIEITLDENTSPELTARFVNCLQDLMRLLSIKSDCIEVHSEEVPDEG